MSKVPKRAVLTISGSMTQQEADEFFPLGVYDCLLPCRLFDVTYKAAVPKNFSVLSEFVLRLIKATGEIDENDIGNYFGLNHRELSYVLVELDEAGYLTRGDGQVCLSAAGEQLFTHDSPIPKIFAVEELSKQVGIDLISLCLEERKSLTFAELRFPELAILDAPAASSAGDKVISLFSRNFSQFSSSATGRWQDRPILYSVDGATPLSRFSATVRINIGSKPRSPTSAEINLSDWGDEYQIEDRVDILRTVQDFAKTLYISRSDDAERSFEVLTTTATEFLAEWTRSDGLAIRRYYNECLGRVGEVRSDRKTIPVLGSLFVKENLRRLLDQLKYASTPDHSPKSIFWIAPNVPHWGATRNLSEIVATLQDRYGEIDNSPDVIGVCAKNAEWVLSRVFDKTIDNEKLGVPRGLEVLLIPDVLCSVIVHEPLEAPRGLPVPLGYISRDSKVIERTRKLLSDLGSTDETLSELISDIRPGPPNDLSKT
jgi:hypothetical protein